MADINSPRPRFSEREASSIARKLYGIDAAAVGLTGERDQNFLLRDEPGQKFVLKIYNTTERKDVLDFQNRVLQHLAQALPGLLYPRVRTGLDGALTAEFEGGRGEIYLVRVLDFVPGVFLADASPHGAGLLRSIGRFMGRTDRALEGFTHPAMNRDLKWNPESGLGILAGFVENRAGTARGRLVEDFLRRFDDRVVPLLPKLRRSVIHNDANDYNILLRGAGTAGAEVAGIIDFGDMLRTWTVCEPAVAAAYAMLGKRDPVAAAVQVVAGYHEEYPLTAVELEVVYHFICLRLCMSVAISDEQYRRDPDNEYLKISEKPAWELLHRLANVRFAEETQKPPAAATFSKKEITEIRAKHTSAALSVSYKKPLQIVRGYMQYLYDERGREYLDAVNNVPHVGHCHPRVVEAAHQQASLLNTNTRYLNEKMALYTRRLCNKFPDPLSVCFLVCSGSEANDLALRLARAHTGHKDVIVLDGAYHGNLTSLVEISPYKFDGPGGSGAPDYVHKVDMPDTYRGTFRAGDPDAAAKYARQLGDVILKMENKGKRVAAFISEPLMGCAGQIVPPDGYLEDAYRYVRESGGVCIADEVQIGFGRVGSHFWGFETQGVVPDIVTLGKPIGNGFPLAAVITTPRVAASFETGMEYFNTYGGNPVSCAVGLAVLDVIEDEDLRQNASAVGAKLLDGLRRLMDKHGLIGDVRGKGLFTGVELVGSRETLTPAADEASLVVEKMKDRGILISVDGTLCNVLKIKPPMVFTAGNADHLVSTLDEVLTEGAG